MILASASCLFSWKSDHPFFFFSLLFCFASFFFIFFFILFFLSHLFSFAPFFFHIYFLCVFLCVFFLHPFIWLFFWTFSRQLIMDSCADNLISLSFSMPAFSGNSFEHFIHTLPITIRVFFSQSVNGIFCPFFLHDVENSHHILSFKKNVSTYLGMTSQIIAIFFHLWCRSPVGEHHKSPTRLKSYKIVGSNFGIKAIRYSKLLCR